MQGLAEKGSVYFTLDKVGLLSLHISHYTLVYLTALQKRFY